MASLALRTSRSATKTCMHRILRCWSACAMCRCAMCRVRCYVPVSARCRSGTARAQGAQHRTRHRGTQHQSTDTVLPGSSRTHRAIRSRRGTPKASESTALVRTSAFGPSRIDPAILQHHDAIDFRDDVGQVVRDEDDVGALLRQRAQPRGEVAAGTKVQAVGRLIQHQRPAAVRQARARPAAGGPLPTTARSPDARAGGRTSMMSSAAAARASMSGITVWCGHRPTAPKKADSTSSRPVIGLVQVAIRSLVTIPRCSRSSGKHPAVSPHHAEHGVGRDDGIQLRVTSLMSVDLPEPFGPENRDVLSRGDGEREIDPGLASGRDRRSGC